jgi:hypothetical protein
LLADLEQKDKAMTSSKHVRQQIASLASGECRWIGRHDVHAYCRAPVGFEAEWCVVCPDAGLEYGNWVTAEEAAAVIGSIV